MGRSFGLGGMKPGPRSVTRAIERHPPWNGLEPDSIPRNHWDGEIELEESLKRLRDGFSWALIYVRMGMCNLLVGHKVLICLTFLHCSLIALAFHISLLVTLLIRFWSTNKIWPFSLVHTDPIKLINRLPLVWHCFASIFELKVEKWTEFSL